MGMMAATTALLFIVGYASGYFVRAALSWIRRSRMRKQRAERKAEAQLKQAAGAAAVSAATAPAIVDAIPAVAGMVGAGNA